MIIFLFMKGDLLGSSMSCCLKRCHTLVPSSASDRALFRTAWDEISDAG